MQKGKAAASPPGMILQNREPQQNARDPPPSQQRSDDDNPGQVQPYQFRRTENRWVRQGECIQIGSEEEQKTEMPPGQMYQNLVMQQMPGSPQGQPRLPNQQPFYPNQRSIRIPRHQPPNNQPMYSSPPEGPPMAVQMIGPPGTTQFMPPGQYPPFITQPMLLQVPGPVALTSEETDKTEEVVTVESQSIFDTPPLQAMTGMPQYQTQTFEPRTRERKIIQIKDPNSNKDMTQEILNRQRSGRLTGSAGGTPTEITPDISGKRRSSSIPPLTLQQQAEANVRAQFAAQVAALLGKSEDNPKKPKVIIQKAPVNNKAVVDTVQLKETTVTQKNEVIKETRTNPTAGIDTQLAEKPVEKPLETQPKEAVQGTKLSEGVSGDISLGPKSLVSSVDATTSAKDIIPNVRVEIFTADELRKKEARQISVAAAGEVKPERKQKSEETAKEPVSDVIPVTETKTLIGPVALTNEETDKTEEVVAVESQPVVDTPPVQAMTGMPQYQTQTFEPRVRERKIIQIKDPNNNKDMTQEILNRQRSRRLTGSTCGTSNKSTPDISGRSSSSSIPPLTLQQQAEANVRAQFAAQVAATLANSEDKPKKPEVIIQKAPVNNKAVVDTVQLKETTVTQKHEVIKETRTNPATRIDTQLAEKPVEKSLETQPKEVHVKTQPKQAVQGSKRSEGVSGDIALGSKSLVSSVNATTSAKEIFSNVRVELFTADEVRKKEAQLISLAAASEVKPERKQKSEETAKELVSDVMPVTETKILDGPVALTNEETGKTEEVVTVESQPVVDTPPVQAMTRMPQYQTQTFEPRARERKIIQIKDPNSNKDVTQEILNRQPSGSLTGSTGGTPNNITPDISGQSSSSSIPPLTLQQQAEANVRVQFAAQVAATLGEPVRELTEVHCDESKIYLEHLEELRMEEYISLSDPKTPLMEKLRVTEELLRISEDQLRVKDEQQQTLQRHLTTLLAEKETQVKENEKLQDQLSVKRKEFADLEKEFRDSVQDQVDLKRELFVANKKLSKYESQSMTRDRIISRDEIEIMFENRLGDGGYGRVYRGRYRGFVVAVKTLKDITLDAGGRDLFEREMDIASRCRHPCLLQFIGATQGEKPLFVTELMELSLRELLTERRLSEKEIVVISLDVAHALNYLHNRKPSPIVHRDVSSANVLLWKQNNQWRGKLGDYGTVKFLQEIMTKSPGAMPYSAPEAGSPFNQTVKIDVYSFGVLVCEKFTGKFPVFEERKNHIDLVPSRPGREFRELVLWCTKEDPTRRPSMEAVIKKLETFITIGQNLLEKSC